MKGSALDITWQTIEMEKLERELSKMSTWSLGDRRQGYADAKVGVYKPNGLSSEYARGQRDYQRKQLNRVVNTVEAANKFYAPQPSMRLFIATVFAKRGNNLDSLKSHGGWEAFIGRTQSEAVEKAIRARNNWGGQYDILVGPLTEKVITPTKKYEMEVL